MPWDTEEDYDIINTMKIFMGENEGRKLFFDTFIPRKYEMQSQHSIFENFKDFIENEERSWKRNKPLLLVVTYKNHYTGIRVDLDGKITLFDPNYNNSLYKPITLKMRKIIGSVFDSYPTDYVETCQITHDEADSFCQTWSLYLLTHPTFKPPETVRDRFSIILSIYKRLLKSIKGKTIYTKFLNEYEYLPVSKYMNIINMQLDTFIKAMYISRQDYINRGFNLKF